MRINVYDRDDDDKSPTRLYFQIAKYILDADLRTLVFRDNKHVYLRKILSQFFALRRADHVKLAKWRSYYFF